MKIGVISLGCPKNLVDTEIMLGLIKEKNFEITNVPAEANIIIVNTCGFIETAKKEAIDTIFAMVEYKKNGNCNHLIVSGCLGQRYADTLLDEIPEVDCIVGTDYYGRIIDAIKNVQEGKRFSWCTPNADINPIHEAFNRVITTPNYTAYLKIAEGCDNKCTYCIIPQLRGKYISKKFEQIVAEANELVNNGAKEIILVAQDTTRYGEDLYGKLRLAELLKELNKIKKIKWIRVLYCYPQYFTDELIETFATCEKVCNYIDIPLQHASNVVLKRMNRNNTLESVQKLLKKIESRIPNICIRTTFIVGFPGETEEDFIKLKKFLQEQRFDNVGVFRYSQEEDTPAALMSEQISDEVKDERYHQLMSIQAEISENINKDMENRVLDVVIEDISDDSGQLLVMARSYREAPEIDGTIFVEKGTHLSMGDFVTVKISQGFTYELVAELVEE